VRATLVALVLSVMLVIPSVAAAQTPTDDIYAPIDIRDSGASGNIGDGSGNAATAGDKLPFSGLDVGIVALAGAAVLGTGLVIRRASRPDAG
jgi:hypothetical protein